MVKDKFTQAEIMSKKHMHCWESLFIYLFTFNHISQFYSVASQYNPSIVHSYPSILPNILFFFINYSRYHPPIIPSRFCTLLYFTYFNLHLYTIYTFHSIYTTFKLTLTNQKLHTALAHSVKITNYQLQLTHCFDYVVEVNNECN